MLPAFASSSDGMPDTRRTHWEQEAPIRLRLPDVRDLVDVAATARKDHQNEA